MKPYYRVIMVPNFYKVFNDCPVKNKKKVDRYKTYGICESKI